MRPSASSGRLVRTTFETLGLGPCPLKPLAASKGRGRARSPSRPAVPSNSGRRRKHRVRRQCPALTPYRSREKAAATTRSPTGSEAARAAHRRRSFCQHLRRPRELYGARTGGALRVACGQQRSRKPARRQHEAPQLVRPGRKAWESGLGWGPLATLIIHRSVVCSETLGPLAGTVGAVGRCGGDTAAAAPCTRARRRSRSSNLVDPASSHTLVSKIKPCTSK